MSLKLDELKVAPGAVHEHFRKGMGLGTGNGKRAGRGQKGAGARSGAGIKAGFTGGQLPLYRAFPKRGFTSLDHDEVIAIVSLDQLSKFNEGDEVNFQKLVEARIIKAGVDGFKVLGNGKLTVKNLTVKADAFSASAKKAIEENGGKAIIDGGDAAND